MGESPELVNLSRFVGQLSGFSFLAFSLPFLFMPPFLCLVAHIPMLRYSPTCFPDSFASSPQIMCILIGHEIVIVRGGDVVCGVVSSTFEK
jgi:hypothetical protein